MALRPALDRRAFGLWSLGAIGLNAVIGAGFFLTPAGYWLHAGAWAPLLILLVGLSLVSVGLCFAEAGSRFDASGGPYLYTRTAFGPLVGFQVSWMMWAQRTISHASVLAALLLAAGLFWPGLSQGFDRLLAIGVITASLALLSMAGAAVSARALLVISVLKFGAIAVFIGIGLAFVDFSRVTPGALPPLASLATAALLMVYGLGGFEMLTVPAGEATAPRAQVPRALLVVLGTATLFISAATFVTFGVLPDMSGRTTPMTDAAAAVAGAVGALLIAGTAVVAGLGHNASSLIAGPRLLSALADQGDLPRALGWRHPERGTPVVAIAMTGAAVALLTATGSFETLALVSAGARILVYGTVALATWRLRGLPGAPPAAYTPPAAGVLPWIALAVCAFLLTGLKAEHALAGLAALALGFVLWALARRR
jgi:basic amino acid/polyamine antiporter, APA family